VFLEVCHAPHPQGWAPALPSFGVSRLVVPTHFHAKWANSYMLTQMGRGLVIRGSATLSSQGAGPQHPQILGLPLCLHPLLQNDQIRRGNTYGDGRVLGVSHAIEYYTNASRGLSAIAEFLVFFQSSAFMVHSGSQRDGVFIVVVTLTNVDNSFNKLCAWRGDTICPPGLLPVGAPTPRAAKQTQLSSSFPRPIRSHICLEEGS